MKISECDISRNDIDDIGKVSEVPLILLFKKDDKQSPIRYEHDEITLENLLEFLSQHTSSYKGYLDSLGDF